MSTDTIDARGFEGGFDYAVSGPWTGYWIAMLRLLTGWWFLHAGLDKYLSPGNFGAAGYLEFGTSGAPEFVHGFFMWVVNTPAMLAFTNFMIPLGELLIGLGLILGALTRLAAFFGAFLMLFFYLGNADWAHGFVSGDLMGLLLFGTVMVFGAGRVWGVDRWLEDTAYVQNNRWLRYLLG